MDIDLKLAQEVFLVDYAWQCFAPRSTLESTMVLFGQDLNDHLPLKLISDGRLAGVSLSAN